MDGMASLAQKIRCEQQARELVRENGVPEPDRVEYGYRCIRLFWEESRTVLVVDIDGPDALAEAGEGAVENDGEYRDLFIGEDEP
jgi:hypothetical protein